MDSLVTEELRLAERNVRERLGDFAGVRLEQSFSGASTSGGKGAEKKKKSKSAWKQAFMGGGSDAKPNDALKKAITGECGCINQARREGIW